MAGCQKNWNLLKLEIYILQRECTVTQVDSSFPKGGQSLATLAELNIKLIIWKAQGVP